MKTLLLCVFFLATSFLYALKDPSLSDTLPYHTEGRNKVGYLSVSREHAIDQSTYLYVKFALEEYKKAGVSFIVLQLDTPGGEVFAATQIAKALIEIDQKDHIPVIALIDNWALSAGALLAYSCRYIAVVPQGLMGAAEPVMANSSGQMESAPEKIKSALRAEFGTLAKTYGRNPWIAEAMVDKDLIIIKRQAEVIRLHQMSEIKKGDEIISGPDKLLTLDADQLLALQVADFELSAKGDLFELPFFSSIPQLEKLRYESWKISFFAFLTNPLISSLLMMGLVAGAYLEMQHPGMGLPALVSVSCLVLILLSHFSIQTADWLELIFILVGIILLLVEVFIFPGFGVAGVLGLLFVLFGVGTLLLPAWDFTQFSWNRENWNLSTIAFIDRLEWLLGALLVGVGVIITFTRYLTPRLLEKNKMILHSDQEGSVAGIERDQMPRIGTSAKALTALRPGGKALINEQIYDVLTEGDFIDQGAEVAVSKIQGSRILVKKK